MQKSLLIRFC